MNENTNSITMLLEKAEDYSKTSLELIWLQAIDKSADVVSSLVVKLAIYVLAILFIFMLNIGISLWLGDLLGKSYYGFFAVATGYVFIGVLLNSFRVQLIKNPVSNAIITKMLSV